MTLCGIAFPLAFGGAAAGIFIPDSPTASLIGTVGGGTAAGLGILGAILGVLFVLRRLNMGCPRCGAISRVIGGAEKDIYVECPSCGQVRASMRWLRTPLTEVVEPADEEA